VCLRIIEALLDIDLSCEMDARVHVVFEELIDVCFGSNVPFVDVERIVVSELLNIPLGTIREVIKPVNGVSSIEKFSYDPPTDESRRASNRDCLTH
jgi:hypothetical protein